MGLQAGIEMPESEVASDSDRLKFKCAAGRDSVVGFEDLLHVVGPTLGAPAFARSL